MAICPVDFRVARASLAITSSAPATRRTKRYGTSWPKSLRLDAGGIDHFSPFLGLVGDELAEIGGRPREHRDS